ncbi:MAG: hypothetical protein IJI14_12480 [Anaerolineaceae bacterium]|nr:hypothetical protein [Anaerolineaceae bacterium]
MNNEKLSQKDYELINSYLDQELDRKEVLRFSERMAESAEIRDEISELMKVKAMVKELPTVTPPRNYILTRAMAEEARPKPWWERLFPVFRTAAAFCALALAFTFLFPLIQQQSANSTETANVYSADSMAAESMAMEMPVQKSVSLLDEEIVLEDRDFGGAAEESYRAVMPSYGVIGGNPRIEYMMRQEENLKAQQQAQSAANNTIPDGYISIEEAQQAVRSTALKIIFGGGLLLSIAVLFVLHKRRKGLEVS